MNTAYAELLTQEKAWPPAVPMAIEVPSPTYPHWHDFNPWGEFCVYVSPEELAACHKQIGKNVDIGERGARMVLLEPFIHIKMVVDKSPKRDGGTEPFECSLVADDGNDNQLWSRTVTWTDCPEGIWDFYLEDGGAGRVVLLLPSEH